MCCISLHPLCLHLAFGSQRYPPAAIHLADSCCADRKGNYMSVTCSIHGCPVWLKTAIWLKFYFNFFHFFNFFDAEPSPICGLNIVQHYMYTCRLTLPYLWTAEITLILPVCTSFHPSAKLWLKDIVFIMSPVCPSVMPLRCQSVVHLSVQLLVTAIT